MTFTMKKSGNDFIFQVFLMR